MIVSTHIFVGPSTDWFLITFGPQTTWLHKRKPQTASLRLFMKSAKLSIYSDVWTAA
jgi:hypothetical protein